MQGLFFTKKVTLIIGVFPSANFAQEKYFSPSNQFFLQEINFPYVDTKYCYAILCLDPLQAGKIGCKVG